MNLDNITPQGYILAMIIRDDGERILLGDGAYVFKDNLQHFQPNTYANDVVELQGTDGQLLAGQVRRTAIQNFAGYIGDASTSQEQVEQYRKQFLMFFRKKFHYTAVYIFHDGSAIQRKRGYIATAPAVPELYQRYPEWSVGLNFEDPNYYEYAEDDEGNEIYAHAVEIAISNAVSGGLVWDNNGATSDELGYTGTPIEGQGKSFQLTGTGDKILKSAELLGDATQTTYTGKNLFNLNATPTLGRTTVSVSGQSVTVTTDATASTARATFPIEYEANREMTVSFDATCLTYEPTASNTVIVYMRTTGQSDATTQITLNKTVGTTVHYTRTFTPNNDTKDLWFYLKSSNIAGVVSYRFDNVQLEYGGSETSYEKFVGGTASPNPDYPQAVNTVTGEQTVKIEGKNLFDKDNADTANGYLSGSTGAFVAGGGSYATKNATFLPAGDYVASQMLEKVCHYALDGSYIGLITRTGSNNEKFTMPSVGFVRLQFPSSFNADTFQLELGSTATAYEPYQGQTLPVNLGKNLFDLSSLSATNITVADNEVYGSASAFNTTFSSTGIVVPTSGQFTLSIVGYTDGNQAIENTSGLGFRVGYTDGTYSSYTYWQNNNTTATLKTFTSDGNKTPDKLYFSFASKGQNIWHLSKIQLEVGSTATTYAPYFTPIELAKIGTYQDRIYNDNGTWKIHKEVGKAVLDGTETWNGYVYGGIFRGQYNVADIKDINANADFIGMSDYFYADEGVLASTTIRVGMFCQYQHTTGVYFAAPSSVTTMNEWKTWLGTHPTTVYYALATPTTTEITNTALITQLNALKHANTYNDITNFSTSSVNLNGFLKVKAYPKGGTPTGGYIWEAGGAGGPTTITVEGVDDASPIWTVIGPATNPTLTNITTGQTITWTGTVPSGQELVIDMANQTASLSGANVFEFVSGSWVTLEPGNNRISYNATNATEPSKLEWNGVTG